MNPEELKIGDLVRVVKDDYIISKGTICKVIGVNAIDLSVFGGHKPVVSLSTVNKEKDIRSMSCENIEGIHLTKDILLKNGWEIVSCRVDGEEIYARGGTCRFTRLININSFYLDGARYNTTGQWLIRYVHELQHHLWALGINDNIKV